MVKRLGMEGEVEEERREMEGEGLLVESERFDDQQKKGDGSSHFLHIKNL